MKILLCSDGTPASDNATRLCGLLTAQCPADITVLGIAEQAADETPLRAALEKEADSLRASGSKIDIAVGAGDPIRQILNTTLTNKYDLALIGTRGAGPSGLYLLSARTYEVIKAIEPAVLVAIGECAQLKRILVCTGGKKFIDPAVRLTAEVALCARASVTLLHVMAEPPVMYADLVALEEDVDRLIESGSELGQNLRAEKEMLEKRGVSAQIQIRHGIVVEQVFSEVREGNHDLIVTGSSRSRGSLRNYIMGDLTRSILNRAECSVLVARVGDIGTTSRGLFGFLKRIFSSE